MRIVSSLLLLLFSLTFCGPKASVKTISGYPEQANRGEDKSVLSTISELPTTLHIGELNKIDNLDPLFVTNASARRVIPLIYEGLVQLNENNEVVPALAKRWSFSEDSLIVTFVLGSRFFQNNPAFNNGLGRKVSSFDVKRVFERMATLQVPPHAARLFISHIRGFDAYFREQHEVFDADQRRLSEIVGIQTPTDSTVRFLLSNTDHSFLEKLASPFAVVYPDEVVKKYDKGLARNPVGTGLFRLERFTSDTLITLEKNPEYPGASDIFLDRVEILALENEATLYKRFAVGRIQLIPRLGPLMLKTLVNSENQLMESYRENYQLINLENTQTVSLRLNPNNYDGLNLIDAHTIFSKVKTDIIVSAVGMHNFSFENALNQPVVNSSIFSQYPEGSSVGSKIILSFDSDQESKFYGRIIGNNLAQVIGIRLIQSQIVSSDIHFYLENRAVLYPSQSRIFAHDSNDIARIRTRRATAHSRMIAGLKFNSMDWWMDLSSVIIKFSDTETTVGL